MPCYLAPKGDLVMDAKIERDVADSAEGRALMDEIYKAVRSYSDFLEDRGVIWSEHDPDEIPRLKAQALVVTLDYGDGDNAVDIELKKDLLIACTATESILIPLRICASLIRAPTLLLGHFRTMRDTTHNQ
jgi:hypothetical protein